MYLCTNRLLLPSLLPSVTLHSNDCTTNAFYPTDFRLSMNEELTAMNNNNNNNNNIDVDVDVDVDDDATGDGVGSLLGASVHLQRNAAEPSPLLMGESVSPELTEEQKKKRDRAKAKIGSNLKKKKDSYWNVDDGKKRRPAPQKELFPPSSAPPKKKTKTSSAPAKKKTKTKVVSDLFYSAEEKKQIDDSIHEVMTEERIKNQHRQEHDSSKMYSMKRVCDYDEDRKECWGTVIHGYYMTDNDTWWTILFDNNEKKYWTSKELHQARCMYDRTTNKTEDPYGSHRAMPSSQVADDLSKAMPKSASTSTTAQVADDQSLSDISYCDDEQEDIDVSLDETLKFEKTKDDGARSRSYVSSTTKRVCKKKKKTADPTNRKGCWGTVIECGGNHIRNKWTIHFDDKTVEYWNLNQLKAGIAMYKRNKMKDPSGKHKISRRLVIVAIVAQQQQQHRRHHRRRRGKRHRSTQHQRRRI